MSAAVPQLPRFPGIELKNFGNPDTRVPNDIVMHALGESVRLWADPLLGMKAGEQFDQADFDLLEYAARAAPNFGEAMAVIARYLRVMNEATEARLIVEGDDAMWRLRSIDGVVMPPAANDFAVVSSIAFSQRNTAVYVPPREIWVVHERPDYAAEYERRYQAPVRFGAPYNALLMDRSRLDVPMKHTSPDMAAAFEDQIKRVFDKIQNHEGLPGRVRWEIAEQFRGGSASMEKTAKKLAMGVTTLRRKLEEEGTTFSDIVDGLRKELAERHLAGSHVSVSEVAFLLGFSDVRAFGRAFRRWTGQSPTEFRAISRS
jgi:AraC-like DNA-binding protein